MTRPARPLPTLAPDVEIAEFDDELVVLMPGDRRAVHLEAGPALVFDSCRRGHDRASLVEEVSAATGTAPAEATTWVEQTLIELARVGALVPESQGESSALPG